MGRDSGFGFSFLQTMVVCDHKRGGKPLVTHPTSGLARWLVGWLVWVRARNARGKREILSQVLSLLSSSLLFGH